MHLVKWTVTDKNKKYNIRESYKDLPTGYLEMPKDYTKDRIEELVRENALNNIDIKWQIYTEGDKITKEQLAAMLNGRNLDNFLTEEEKWRIKKQGLSIVLVNLDEDAKIDIEFYGANLPYEKFYIYDDSADHCDGIEGYVFEVADLGGE